MKSILLLLLLVGLFQRSLNAQSRSKTYILVHGGWHGAWAWKKVVPLLEAKGNKVLAIDLPGHGEDKTPASTVTLQDCVEKVVSVANSQTGQVILVGHSMAGVVIAQAAEVLGKEKIATLVFLDAFMPQNGESVFSIAEKAAAQNIPVASSGPAPSLRKSMILSDDQKASKLNQENVATLLYHDCSEKDIAFAKSRLGWQPMSVLATPVNVTEARYGAVSKVYILCTEAKDMDKKSISRNVPTRKMYTLNSSHSPFFSMPDKLVAILHEI